MKKKYIAQGIVPLLGAFVVCLMSSNCCGAYVAQKFDDVRTGKKTIFWGNADNGKDAYILQNDPISNKYYFEKVEKNKPIEKKSKSNAKAAQKAADKADIQKF